MSDMEIKQLRLKWQFQKYSQETIKQLARSGAAKPPPPHLFLFFCHAPSLPRDWTDVRVLYILIHVKIVFLKLMLKIFDNNKSNGIL